MSTKTSGDPLLPIIIDVKGLTAGQFIEHYLGNQTRNEQDLLRFGALKFTGIKIETDTDFKTVTEGISSRFLSYIDGNSPRTKLSDTVYTSTEFDKTQRITMHNELSYSAKWPGKIFFSCIRTAPTGGETLLADSRKIVNMMEAGIVEEIEKRGVCYIRNLHGGMGIGPSWQETFETEDPAQLERYCRDYKIDFQWTANGTLRLRQFSKGIIEHRKTGEKLWFNQIDQFHPCHLSSDLYETMKMLYDEPQNFPMYVTFGDGTPIGETTVNEILNTIESQTVAPSWSLGELLILDNELICHGRNPYEGERKVLVAMSE